MRIRAFIYDVQRKFANSSPVHMRCPKDRQEVKSLLTRPSVLKDRRAHYRPSVKDGRACYHPPVHKGQGRLLRLRRVEERTVTSQAQPL